MRVYKWHSINIIPSLSIFGTFDEYRTTGSLIEMVVFGLVIHMDLPWRMPQFSSGNYGPVWSRRRKLWYTIK